MRQDAAKVHFLASLADTQLQWLKQEAKQRVDAQPSARFLTSRYPLYKAEEEQMIVEWMRAVCGLGNVCHTSALSRKHGVQTRRANRTIPTVKRHPGLLRSRVLCRCAH